MALKINWIEEYKGRIEQIDSDIKRAVRKKDWITKNRLVAERKKLSAYIKELEEKQS